MVPSATDRAPRSNFSLMSLFSVNAAPAKRAPYGSAVATAGTARARTEAAASTHHPLPPSESHAPTLMLSPYFVSGTTQSEDFVGICARRGGRYQGRRAPVN